MSVVTFSVLFEPLKCNTSPLVRSRRPKCGSNCTSTAAHRHACTHTHTPYSTYLMPYFPAGSPVIVPGHWCLQCQTWVSSDNNVPIFRANSPATPTAPEGKHKCSCSLLKQLWQNILTRRFLVALLCIVQSGYQGRFLSPSLSLSPAFVTKNISAILSQYWLALCGGK